MTTKKQDQIVERLRSCAGENACTDDAPYRTLSIKIEPIEGTGAIIVARNYTRTGLNRLSYHDSYIVGPRGRIKKIYDRFHA